MKKIVLFAAATFAFSGAFAQAGYPAAGAHNTTSTDDNAPINVSAILTDMFDIAPSSGQNGTTNFTGNWAAWNDGLDVTNNLGGTTYYFLVSATRGFHLTADASDLTRPVSGTIPNDFIQMTASSNNTGTATVNSNWDAAWSFPATHMSDGSHSLCNTTFGGYDMQFTASLRLDDQPIDGENLGNNDLYSLNLPAGTYTGVVTVRGGLN